MEESPESYVRWEPLANLPEHPCGSIQISYQREHLIVTAHYAFDPSSRGIRIDFGRVEAFKVYEEFSDPWMENTPHQSQVRNGQLNQWTWPLQQVINSSWIGRVARRNAGIEGFEWLHYVVVTADMTLHVMTSSAPEDVQLLV
ncbi:hypothetical protein [Sphingopyxis panaciterrae]